MNQTKFLEKLIFVVTGIIFFVPLVITPNHLIFPFIVPKILAFRVLAVVLMVAYGLLLIASYKKYKIQKTPLNIAVAIFALSAILSTVFSTDVHRSFWDSHERMLGLFTLLHYFAFYYIATTVIKGEKKWRQLMFTFLVAANIVFILGVLQRINPEFLYNRGTDRVSGTLGNAIYLGGYGMFSFFLSLFLLTKEKLQWKKIFYVVTAVMGIIAVVISGTRGAFLGLLGGATVVWLGYSFLLEGHKKIKLWLLVIFFIASSLLGVAFLNRDKVFVQNIPLIGRVVTTTLSSTTAQTRWMAWGIALQGWKEKPVLGWGVNNYFFAFNKHYRPEFLKYGYRETWFDNAHNATLNSLTAQGLVGFVAYMGIFIVPVTMMFGAYRKRREIDVHTAVFGIGLIGAHYVQQLFVFENPTSYIYLFMLFAFINSVLAKDHEDNLTGHVMPISSGIQAFVIGTALIFVYSTNVLPAKANMAALDSLHGMYQNSEPLEKFKHVLTFSTPHMDDIRNDHAKTISQMFPTYARGSVESQKTAVDLATLVLEELEKNIEMHPYDLRLPVQYTNTAQLLYAKTRQGKYIVRAKEILEDGITKSPRRQQLYYSVGGIYFQLGQVDQGIATLRKVIEDSPYIDEGWWRLAVLYQSAGKNDEAKAIIVEALDRGVIFSEEGQGVLDKIFPKVELIN
jgi:O-antigen ligase